jgi:hypothetical protein
MRLAALLWLIPAAAPVLILAGPVLLLKLQVLHPLLLQPLLVPHKSTHPAAVQRRILGTEQRLAAAAVPAAAAGL